MCVWQPKAAHAELEDVSCWQQAPVCCWHLGRGFGCLPGWRRQSCLRGYMNRYPVNDLDELPEYFVFPPDAVSRRLPPAAAPCTPVRVWERGAGCWRQGLGSAGRGRWSLLSKPSASAPVRCTWAVAIRARGRTRELLLDAGSREVWVERHYAYFIMCPCITHIIWRRFLC